MIHLSREMADLAPGLIGIVIAAIGWFAGKHTVNKARAAYFIKYGRYPGEPRHEPAE